ncbi:TetR/AcrR family transcriptional regulator [Kibdelosporangium persicum]|uniref:Bacterial transcriptional repressor c-terminal n=1 Tax=Kibdelosporangium persicum TaxID=2698649 RepID=A0ABX2F7R3_9PSEU|nr:TetR/AcrR family transcriptional regulator [Kibdelosporangium persicum]NRN67390.1 Bacterial transcriptional repressor c-terminal [Kibdelosporangium persicum]
MARHKEFDPDVALDRAMEMFWERGYEATSVQDLVEGMGVGRRSLYDTFGDKHALFMRAVNRYIELQEERAATVAKARTARDAIRELISAVLVPNAHLKGCMLVNVATEVAPRDSQAAHQVDRHMVKTRDFLLDLVRRGQQDGSVGSTAKPEALTTMLVNAWLGLRVAVRSGVDRKRLRKDIDEIISLLD